LIKLWNIKADNADASIRPDFQGELVQSPVDQNQQILVYPAWKYAARKAISWTVTLLFCFLDFSCVLLWLDLFSNKMSPVASICQAIMIQVFTQIYNRLAEYSTIAENHKYQTDFYSSYLAKMFIFQFVNQYSAFFYIAIKQQFTPAGCPTVFDTPNNCVGSLCSALLTKVHHGSCCARDPSQGPRIYNLFR